MSISQTQNNPGDMPKPVSPGLSTGPAKTIKNSKLAKVTGKIVKKDLKKTPKQDQDQDKTQGNAVDQDKEEEQDQERKEEQVQDQENGMDQKQEQE